MKLQNRIEENYGGKLKNFMTEQLQMEPSVSQASFQQIQRDKSDQSNDQRLGDCNFVCFRFRKLEFFFPSDQFTRYSDYFRKMH